VLITRSGVLGGIEIHVSKLASFLAKKGCRVIWIILCKDGLHPQFKKIPKVKLLLLNDKYQQSFLSFTYIFTFIHIIWRLRPEVVHLHGIRPMFLFSLFPFPKKTKRISTVHASYLLTAKNYEGKIIFYKKILSFFMHFFAYIRSDIFICVSDFLKKELKNSFFLINFNKTKLIYNGVDNCNFNINVNRYMFDIVKTFKKKELQVVFVGRVELLKGIDTLIWAINKCRKHISVRCHIFGDCDDSKKFVELVRENDLDDIIHFWGSFQDIRCFLGEFDVFVLPSRFEGLPLSVLEAMISGVPVVATKVGGIPEIVDSSVGILFDVDDYDKLSDILINLYREPNLRKKLGYNARMKAINFFSIEEQLNKTYSYYIL
jgi:glycosyltransferase involved in cell wall biosynthesis